MIIILTKRAPTFQINVAVTNFAPERIVSDKRGSAADKCIRIETYTWHSRQLRYRGRKSSPQMTSNKKKKKKWGGRTLPSRLGGGNARIAMA